MAIVCLLFSQLCSSRLKLELSYRSKLLVIHSLHASQLYDDDVAFVVLVYLINDREFINVWYGSKCCSCTLVYLINDRECEVWFLIFLIKPYESLELKVSPMGQNFVVFTKL